MLSATLSIHTLSLRIYILDFSNWNELAISQSGGFFVLCFASAVYAGKLTNYTVSCATFCFALDILACLEF